jgi:hypothetical protein
MTAPHPDDPRYDDWAAQDDSDAGAFAERTEENWQVTDDAGANWALRKIARAEAEIARVEAVAYEEVARITQWKADTVRGPKDDIGFFKAHLVDYRRRLEDADPQLPKTYKLPAGDLTRRKGATRIEVTDEAAFVAWAEANDPSLLSRKPLVSRLKDQKDRYTALPPDGDEGTERATWIVTTDGEGVPGVEQVFAPEQYSVRTR